MPDSVRADLAVTVVDLELGLHLLALLQRGLGEVDEHVLSERHLQARGPGPGFAACATFGPTSGLVRMTDRSRC
jgi:hypothetical protein